MTYLENIIELSCSSGWNCIAINCTIFTSALFTFGTLWMIAYVIEVTIDAIKK